MDDTTEWEEEHLLDDEPKNGKKFGIVWSWKNARLGAAFVLVLIIGFVGGMFVGTPVGAHTVSGIPLIVDGLVATPDNTADFTDFWKVWSF
jgi:hypothetical protein